MGKLTYLGRTRLSDLCQSALKGKQKRCQVHTSLTTRLWRSPGFVLSTVLKKSPVGASRDLH